MNKEDIKFVIEAFYTVNRRIRTFYNNDMDLCIKYARTDKYLEDILEVYNELKKAEEYSMNKVEKIKAEIKRLKQSNKALVEDCPYYDGLTDSLDEILSFIDSLEDTEKDFGIKESVIPFGASDSELMEATYFIPQGYHAVIDGNKVIIKKGEEPVSNDLEKAAVEAFKRIVDSDKNSFYEIFKAGAQWGKEQTEIQIKAQSIALPHGCPKEEPVSKDLEETSKQYALNNSPWDDCWPEVQDAFKAGAQWQKERDQSTIELAENHAYLAGQEKIIEKACKWLNIFYSEDRHCYFVEEDIDNFKKAMEE